jgi:acetyl-CoA acyltransferase
MKNVVIAGYSRSPFTPANSGELKKVRPDELTAQVILGLLKKTNVQAGIKCGAAYWIFS